MVLSGSDSGTSVELGPGTFVVGRDPGCDVVLADRRVSKRHANLQVGATVTIADLESTNGTAVHGQRLEAAEILQSGDVVSIGGVELLVDLVEGGSTPPVEATGANTKPPSRAGRTVLIAHAAADHAEADRLARQLADAGHAARLNSSTRGDGWGGRLLDAVWGCDGVIFVVSAAGARSAKLRREVHVGAGQRRPVLPVLVGPAHLPDDLAWYLELVEPVDLAADRVGGVADVLRWVSGLRRRRINRPVHLAGSLLGTALVLGAVAVVALRIVAG